MRPAWWLAAWLLLGVSVVQAASTGVRYCDQPQPLSARQQDRLLQFAAVARRELEGSGHDVALVARSGLDLSRFGVRYSHAGVSLRASGNAPWSVRQLYFSCDEGRPRLYDQGLAGFVLAAAADATVGYLSIVWLPREQAQALERAVLDNARALRLLAADYSANAYPFSVRYQNCNQWVIELLAAAWGGLPDDDALRARAQAWLAAQRYDPAAIDVGSWLMIAGHFVPWVHYDDHPQEDLAAQRLRTSLPLSIEAFVRDHVPGAQRIELCHDERRVVIHRGWQPLPAGCLAGPDDRVIALD